MDVPSLTFWKSVPKPVLIAALDRVGALPPYADLLTKFDLAAVVRKMLRDLPPDQAASLWGEIWRGAADQRGNPMR